MLALAFCSVGSSMAYAQDSEVLLRVGELLPLGSQDAAVQRLIGVRAAGPGTFVAVCELKQTYGPIALWGSWTGADSSGVLSTIDLGDPASGIPFKSRIDTPASVGAAGPLVYSADVFVVEDGVTEPPGFRDTVWLREPSQTGADTTLLLTGEAPVPGADPLRWWSAIGRVAVTPAGSGGAGTPVWLAGTSDAAHGLARSTVLGQHPVTGPRVILGPGDPVGGGGRVQNDLGVRDFALSASGSQAIAVVRTSTAAGEDVEAVARVRAVSPNEAVSLLGAGDPVSDVRGRTWQRFYLPMASDRASCSGPGSWGVGADLSAPADRNSTLVVDGHIVMREGDTVAGGVLAGEPLATAMNAVGDYAVVWAWGAAGTERKTALFFDGVKLLGAGDTISTTNGPRLVRHVYPMVALGDSADGSAQVPLYVIAEIDEAGSGIQSLVRMPAIGLGRLACNPDLNEDGNADQEDVLFLVNVVAGGTYTGSLNLDFNCDGNTDQDDVAVLISVVAGGPCP